MTNFLIAFISALRVVQVRCAKALLRPSPGGIVDV